ncbi:MAG: TolC family protein [Alphaproteobacteria bacterium]|nr:MAG: TolC family protein [Alphaproteobacteria bacterium]
MLLFFLFSNIEQKSEGSYERKSITVDFFVEKLKDYAGLQAYKSEFLKKKHKETEARSAFLPKAEINLDYQNKVKMISPLGMKDPEGKREWDLNARGEAQLNVFNGFGDIAAFKEAKHYTEAGRFEYYRKISKLFLDALDAMGRMNHSAANVEAMSMMLDSKAKIYNMAKNKFKNEAISKGELQTALAEKNIAQSNKYRHESEYMSHAADFESKSGIKAEANYIIDTPEKLPETYEQAEQMMLRHNFDIQEAEYKVKQAESGLKKSKGAFFPKIDLYANGRKKIDTDDNKDIKKNDKENEIEYVWGARASYQFTGFRDTARYKEAVEALSEARYSYHATLNRVKSELKMAWDIHRMSQKQCPLLTAAVNEYQAAVDAEMIKYESGAKDMSKLIQAQEALAEAKNRLAHNEKNLRLESWRLTILVGDLPNSLKGI